MKALIEQYWALALFFLMMFCAVLFVPETNIARARHIPASKVVVKFDGGATIYRYVDLETGHVCFTFQHQIECEKF